MIKFRKIDPERDLDIKKYMIIRKKSLKDDLWNYNLMTYSEEEEKYTVEWYKKYNYLDNYFVLEDWDNFIWYIAYSQDWINNFQWNHNFSIWPIYINNNYRWKGLWKKLLTETINYITQIYNNINLNLLVNKNSIIPINLYKSLWFLEVWTYNNYIKTKEWKYFNVVIMSKSYIKTI